jgi:Ca2+-binding EF-hand superfamily protein
LEKQTDENELLRIFKGMDATGDGFISHSKLEKALTTVSSLDHLQKCRRVS